MARLLTSPIFRLCQHRSVALPLLAALFVCLLLSACVTAPQAPAPAEQAALAIDLLPPETGASHLQVRVTGTDGAPVTDAQVSLEGNMNHAGMVPVISDAVSDDADGAADGVYQVPFEFTMFGDWIITVSVTTADGAAVSENVDVSVDESGARLVGAPQGDASAGGLHISDVRARPVPMPGGNTAVFLTIANHGDQPDRLVDARSDAAEVVELHETVKDGDMMRMVHMPEGFELPPGETVELMPGGKHVMLLNVTAPMAVGDEIQVELVFEHGEPVTLIVPVVEMAASMP